MADPLSFLRYYNANRIPITERNDQIIFGEYSWHKTVKTNFIITRSKKEETPKEYYTLESLLFFIRNLQGLTHLDYVNLCTFKNIPAVRRPDRKELMAYLSGRTSFSNSIDKSAPIETHTTVRHIFEEQNQEKVVKKPRLEETSILYPNDIEPSISYADDVEPSLSNANDVEPSLSYADDVEPSTSYAGEDISEMNNFADSALNSTKSAIARDRRNYPSTTVTAAETHEKNRQTEILERIAGAMEKVHDDMETLAQESKKQTELLKILFNLHKDIAYKLF